jgi:hypothetical protein
MFVRNRQRGDRLTFAVVSSYRSEGKVRQTVHVSLGTVRVALMGDELNFGIPVDLDADQKVRFDAYYQFWKMARSRVIAWDKSKWAFVREGIHVHLPRELHYYHFQNALMRDKLGATLKRKWAKARP